MTRDVIAIQLERDVSFAIKCIKNHFSIKILSFDHIGNIDYNCPASGDCEINKRRRKACQVLTLFIKFVSKKIM